MVLYLNAIKERNIETIRSAIRHEIGHLLGFQHSKRPTYIMYESIDNLFNQKVLSDWEIEAFKVGYK